ncbi:MAG: hypothetical protein N3F64_07515 [Nitrososphaeria archaeon]|nr:hypothetical protein [Nitrososphaeria archaeon]
MRRNELGRFTKDSSKLDLREGCVWRRLAIRKGWKYFTIAVEDLEKLLKTKFDGDKVYKIEYEVEGHVMESAQSFKQKYVELHVPKNFTEKFETGKLYKIKPRRFKKIGYRTRKKMFQKRNESTDYEAKIILPKGNYKKARIEISKSLQEYYKIRKEKVVKIELETSIEKFDFYTRTRNRPLIVTIPKKYAQEEKLKVKKIKEYTLKDFITEYDKQKPIKHASIKQENDALILEIGEHKIEAKKYNFNTYGGKPYLEIEHTTDNTTTKYRIIKEDSAFKVYRISGKGYEQITNTLVGENKIVFIVKHGKREKRHLFYKKEGKETISLGDPELFTEEIDNKSIRAIVVFPRGDIDKIITGLVEYGKERCYSKGTLGERVAERTLRKLNYQIIGSNKESSKHSGDDIIVLKNGKKAYVEVKYVTNKLNINYKIMQAFKELRNRHLNENGTLIAAIITYLGETKFEVTLKFQTHSSSPKFFHILLNIAKT